MPLGCNAWVICGSDLGQSSWFTWANQQATGASITSSVWTYAASGSYYTIGTNGSAISEYCGVYIDDLNSGVCMVDWNEANQAAGGVIAYADDARLARDRAVLVAKDEADKKAQALLMSLLTPDQQQQYKSGGYFEVLTTRNGELRRYRINRGVAGNIIRVNEQGRALEKYCIHAVEHFPPEDHMIAQKLMLESDEEEFLRIANRTAYPPVAQRA